MPLHGGLSNGRHSSCAAFRSPPSLFLMYRTRFLSLPSLFAGVSVNSSLLLGSLDVVQKDENGVPVVIVEVDVVEQRIVEVPKPQVVEVEKRVPKYEIVEVEKRVEVPQIKVVERRVEVI